MGGRRPPAVGRGHQVGGDGKVPGVVRAGAQRLVLHRAHHGLRQGQEPRPRALQEDREEEVTLDIS